MAGKADAVKVIKLTNGEELVAECSLKNGKYTLKQPARFMISGDGIAMMPWLPLSDDKTFELDEKLIMLTASVDNEIRNAYSQRFGSGLVLPAAQTLKLSVDD